MIYCLQPGVEGWYYLLSEQLGFRKHLSAPSSDNNNQTPGDKMTDSRPPLEGAPSSPAPHSQSADISLVNKKTRGLQSQTVSQLSQKLSYVYVDYILISEVFVLILL